MELDFSRYLLKLREYQQEIFETVKDKNSICLLGTGSGKTMIAIHVMKHVLTRSIERKKVVFLAPTVIIVQQQYDVCLKALPFKVGIFCQNESVSLIKEYEWKSLIEEYDVFIFKIN
jgi:endoribonuclease Dicer